MIYVHLYKARIVYSTIKLTFTIIIQEILHSLLCIYKYIYIYNLNYTISMNSFENILNIRSEMQVIRRVGFYLVILIDISKFDL